MECLNSIVYKTEDKVTSYIVVHERVKSCFEINLNRSKKSEEVIVGL